MGVGDVREESSAVLGLQVVVSLRVSLVYGGLDFGLLWLASTTGNDHIQTVDLVDLELDFRDSVLRGLLVEDDVVAIEEVSHDLVTQDTLNWVDTVAFADLLSVSSDVMVESTSLDDSHSSLQTVPSSQDDVSLDASDLILTNNNSMSQESRETIEMDTQITAISLDLHFGNITLGQNGVII